ncbi:MAG: hypothetical protein C0478_07385 [Planctomyces sp.]|nr:hypothetical protein [Planctomyces sp.]
MRHPITSKILMSLPAWETTALLVALVAWLMNVPVCTAQELRVYTTVRDIRLDQTDKAPVVARSLTLFHAGKAYDFIEGAQEVTIFEPSLKRFTILALSRGLMTDVTQDEIRHFLSLAEAEAQKVISGLERQETASSRAAASSLSFQLSPTFTTEFQEAAGILTLRSGGVHYNVKVSGAPSSELVESYLRFADSTAQLNSVLYPRALLPAPRLLVNEQLRARSLMPLAVELQITDGQPIRWRAEHEIAYKFAKLDREYIHHWESKIQNGTLKSLPFRQFQQEHLGNISTSRR